MSRTRQLENPGPSWVECLSVLSPAQRLSVQKCVAADVAVQSGWPGSTAPQPPFSRSYASGSDGQLAPKSGLGVYRGMMMARSSCGGHLGEVQRRFPSTAGVLAGMLAEAARVAGRTLPTPATPPPSVQASLVPDPQLAPLAEELHALGLDASYRVALTKSLERRLGGVPGPKQTPEAGWVTEGKAFPMASELLVTGRLQQAVVASEKAGARAREGGVVVDLD